MKKTCWVLAFFSALALGQDRNSLFENPESKMYDIKSVMVQGEVQNPGLADLNSAESLKGLMHSHMKL